jgi:hypothetical protein
MSFVSCSGYGHLESSPGSHPHTNRRGCVPSVQGGLGPLHFLALDGKHRSHRVSVDYGVFLNTVPGHYAWEPSGQLVTLT